MTDRNTQSSLASGESTIRVQEPWEKQHADLLEAFEDYLYSKSVAPDISSSEFVSNYPTHTKSLRKLIQMHECLESCPSMEDVDWPAIGDTFSGFELRAVLGTGATARAYLAREPALGNRLVALKVAFWGEDEAGILGKLAHPNIVPVHAVKVDESSCLSAVVMPYLGSTTLSDVLEQIYGVAEPPLQGEQILAVTRRREIVKGFCDRHLKETPADKIIQEGSYVDAVARIGIQLTSALTYIEHQGLLHRDLKPSNILLTPSGCPMLLDFNLSRETEQQLDRLGGTLPYMPPEYVHEAFLDEPALTDSRSDLFSIGVILYELLTGSLPFGDPEIGVDPEPAVKEYLKSQQTAPRHITSLNKQVERPLADAIHGCLALNIDERTASAAELERELRNHFSWRSRTRRWAGSHRTLVLALAGMLLLSVAGLSAHFATRPSYEDRTFQQGLQLLDQGEYTAAIESFSHLLEYEPHSIRGRLARGLTYFKQERLRDAVLEFHSVSDQEPLSIAYECEAYIYWCLRELKSAAHHYELAAEASDEADEMARLLLNQAYVYEHNQQKTEVLRAVARAIELEPSSASPFLYRAKLYHKFDFQELMSASQAVEDIEEALAKDDSASVNLEAARTYAYTELELAEDFSEEVKQHVTNAFLGGAPARFIFNDPAFKRYKKTEWFERLALDEQMITEPPRPATLTQPELSSLLEQLKNWSKTMP